MMVAPARIHQHEPTNMSLQLENLSKRFGDTTAVDGVSLELGSGETLALLGPSGCGKSTLLRLVAGLETPDRGRVMLGGRDITRLPPQRREFGMVFQDYALFPHLNVERNIAFGLVELGWSRAAQRARVAELLELVGLSGFEGRHVQQLSGGQQQRVALARALAPKPGVLLLDEPLSNLDQGLRETLKLELKEILGALGIQAVYVTHDQSEASAIASRVAVMRDGRLVQLADREELLRRPATTWVARFLGYRNLYSQAELSEVTGLPYPGPALLRSDEVSFGGTTPKAITAIVRSCERQGMLHRLELWVPDWRLSIHWEGFGRELPHDLETGDAVTITISSDAWVPLPGDA